MGLMLVHLTLGGLHLGVHGGHMFVHIIFGRTAGKSDCAGGQGRGGEGGASNILH